MCDNTILEADEDYFDDFILSKCSCEYKSAARVIGEVLGYTDQLIGDQFLHTRIVELIRKGKLTVFNHVGIADDIALCRNRVVINGVLLSYTCELYNLLCLSPSVVLSLQ